MAARRSPRSAKARPGLPKAVLERRLAMLEFEGVVTSRPAVRGRGRTYHLTGMGRELVDVCFALGNWGARWLEVGPEHLDARVVLWSMAHLVDRSKLPEPRIVVRFDITDGHPDACIWLVLERDSVEVCTRDPGFDERMVVTASAAALAAWHMGRISMADARDARPDRRPWAAEAGAGARDVGHQPVRRDRAAARVAGPRGDLRPPPLDARVPLSGLDALVARGQHRCHGRRVTTPTRQPRRPA